MKPDAYTKFVLTVIATALVWIATGGPSLLPGVHAQQKQAAAAKPEPLRVYIAGLVGADGKVVAMPADGGLPVFTMPDAQFVTYTGGWVSREAGERPQLSTFPKYPMPVSTR